jgi:hypothetical protein
MAKPSLKNLPDVSNESRNGDEIKKRLQEGAKDFASLKVEKKPEGKARKKSSLSMPEYVWDLLWEATKENREPQGVIVMRGLKALGFDIDESDLVDARKTR